MVRGSDLTAIETLRKRYQARAFVALSLVRAYRFVVELEPFVGDGPDPFVEAEAVFGRWRRALREGDAEAALDAVETTWTLLEACRQRVVARDAAIEAYRVRWACENASLHHRTIDSLARFYRLLPFSTSSQSKYEYVLTRRLAGPIGPERRIAPTEELTDAVVALEGSWNAPPVAVDESDTTMIALELDSFAQEAARKVDAASFTSSGLLRRFGAFKVSIGPALFDPRVSVAVVEANVRVLNVLNQLLADAGGQPLRGSAAVSAIRKVMAPPVAAAPPQEAAPMTLPSGEPIAAAHEPEAGPEARSERPDTSEIDLSGLEVIRSLRRRVAAEKAAAAAQAPALSPPPPLSESRPEPAETVSPLESAPAAEAAPEPPLEAEPAPAPRPDLRTGEVDLSGLEFVRRRRSRIEAADSAASAEGEGEEEGNAAEAPPAETAEPAPAPVAVAQSEAEAAELPEVEQLPSARAFELGKLEENEAIVDRYLTPPRSPEVWQLDLDVFLGKSQGGVLHSESNEAERRRALELILTSDDLICARALQDDAPSAEHRAQVRAVANAMLMLRTSLRRSADIAQGNAGELEPLLYVADHLLWERLRLEASLKRKPSRPRPQPLPRTNQAAAAALVQTQAARRQRRILVRVVAVAAAVTTIAGLLSFSVPREAVDPEVRLVQVAGLPGADLFDDARAFRTTLFVSVSRTWMLLALEERRSIVRGLGAFAAERGLDTVSVVGPKGEPWATFKDDEVLLDGDLTASDLVKR